MTHMNDNRLWSRDVLSFGPFKLDAAGRSLKRGDDPAPLGGRALDILIALVERAGEIVPHRELIERAWPGVNVEEANLRVNISAIRKALGDGRDGARYISSVARRGYCFVAPIQRSLAEESLPPHSRGEAECQNRLPPRLTRIVGREDTVRTLSAQLMLRRFVSIVGPAGVGKTTVALSVAHGLLADFGGDVFFVDLSALTDPNLVPTAVSSTLGFMARAQDPLGSLLAFVGDRKILLILDNCEHVIDRAAALAERVVSDAPQARILTTSREALRVQGEHVHLLHSLEGPPDSDDLTAAELCTYPAAELFMERAIASGYTAELTDQDARIVARICRKLDGVALAIELVASHVGQLGVRGAAELLDNRFGLLWRGRRTALPRHETLSAMLDWSYSLLSEQEKLVLSRLSVFVGDFSLSAACAVVSEARRDGEVAAIIVNLVAKSLISTKEVRESTYYRLLEMTRFHLKTKLELRGEVRAVCRRHAIFYAEFLEGQRIIQSRFGEHDLSEFGPHMGNVRAALEWAFSDIGDAAIAVALAASAAPLFIGLSLLDECRRWCERALAVLGDTDRDTRREMVLQEALALSSLQGTGHSEQVRPALERALTLAETLGERTHELQLVVGLNQFLSRFGDLRGARMATERGAEVARATSDPAGAILSEWMVGISCCSEGNQAEAQVHCERGFELAAELGQFNANYFGFDHRVRALVALARALWLRGFSDRALATMRKALDEAALQYDPSSRAAALLYASSIFMWTGDFQSARGTIAQLIVHARKYSLEVFAVSGLALEGELAIACDEVESGIELLRRSVPFLRKEYYVIVTIFARALAEGLLKSGRIDEARVVVDDAITWAIDSDVKVELSELLRIKSRIMAPQEGPKQAMSCLTEALEVARAQSALSFELRATMDLARLLLESGQQDQARRSLSLVYDRFTEGFQTADLRAARALLERLQA